MRHFITKWGRIVVKAHKREKERQLLSEENRTPAGVPKILCTYWSIDPALISFLHVASSGRST